MKMASWEIPNFQYNPNLAPTDSTIILRTSSEGIKPEIARFGLVHSWAKDTKSAIRYLNTRMETIRDKPAFKEAYQKRRCVIPVLGFYEFKDEGKQKQAYYFSLKSGETMSLLGLWEYAEIEGEKMFSFSIVTGEPNELVAPFHDRMPLATPEPAEWLDLTKDSLATIRCHTPEEYAVIPIDRIVNNSRNKDIPDYVFTQGSAQQSLLLL